MKATSIVANKKAEVFKVSHKNRILSVLTKIMTGPEIAKKCGLKFESVMRRMSELEKDRKVICKGSRGNYTLYKLI